MRNADARAKLVVLGLGKLPSGQGSICEKKIEAKNETLRVGKAIRWIASIYMALILALGCVSSAQMSGAAFSLLLRAPQPYFGLRNRALSLESQSLSRSLLRTSQVKRSNFRRQRLAWNTTSTSERQMAIQSPKRNSSKS